MKKLLALILTLTMIFVFAGCTSNPPSNDSSLPASSEDDYLPVDIKIAGIKGPTAVGLASLMKENRDGNAQNNYTFSLHAEPNEVATKLIKGELDIAAIPTNLAAKLYKNTNGGIKILAVNTYGVLSIYENGNDINSFSDLKGKTILTMGEGSNPEYILKHILKSNQINPESDVNIEFVGTNDELAGKIALADKNGQKVIAMIPQPFATTVMNKVPSVRKVFDMTEEWEKLGEDGSLMMGCVVVRSGFLQLNPLAVKKFLEEYEESVNAVSDVDKVAALCEEFEIIPSAAVAKKAIPDCHIAYCDGNDMKNRLGGYLKVLYDADPSSIGGQLPDDNFYYIP